MAPSLSVKLSLSKVLLPALALTALTACSTTSPQMRQNLDTTQQKLQAAPVSVLADACLIRLELGTSHVLFEQSEAFATAVATDVRQQLAKRGIASNAPSIPFVCGSVAQEGVTRYDIKMTAEGERQELTTYPLETASNQFDSATDEAYLSLLQTLATLKGSENKVPLAVPIDDALQQRLLGTINSQFVFVIESTGGKKSFGRGMLEGVASTAVLMAVGTNMYAVPQDGAQYAIYLVDLKSKQLLWFKHNQAVNPSVFKAPVATTYTTPKLLNPLYAE